MSAYGPAVSVARKDGAELSSAEQDEILALVAAAVEWARLRDTDDEPTVPTIYDYDECESRALEVLLLSSYEHGQMPEDARADESALWTKIGLEVAAEIERRAPGHDTFTAYGVEA